MQKVINKTTLNDRSNQDLTYWLSKTPAERIAADEYLRLQHHGKIERLQRTVRIIQQT